MQRFYNMLAVFAVATMLSGGAFIGYLFGAGKLNGTRLEKIAAVLRGEPDEQAEPATSRPATTPQAEREAQPRSGAELEQMRAQEQLRRSLSDRSARDVVAQRELLSQTLQHLVGEQEKFEQGKKTWLEQQRKLADERREEGFERELEYVGKLAPKQAKEHLLRTWNKHKADAVRLLNALDTGKGQRILEQLKTPEEVEILHELLEQLRLQDVDKLVPGSGTTSGDAK